MGDVNGSAFSIELAAAAALLQNSR